MRRAATPFRLSVLTGLGLLACTVACAAEPYPSRPI